jgi:aminopeptidase N
MHALLALLVLTAAPDSLLVPGVSHALARHRAGTLSNVRYALSLDLTRDSARALGQLVIQVQRTRGAGDLILDFRGPAFQHLQANGVRVPAPRWADGHIVVPESLLREGENRIQLDFTALIAPAGASIIRYRDATDGSTYLYTLLVPADAHQLFPSFDQPDLKARFTWRIRTVPEWQVLTNGALRHKERSESTRSVLWTFAETEPISTYLAAFAAGPWAIVEHKGAPAMRLFLRKSRVNEADADSILAENAGAYRWLEDFFGVKYPFAKIDLLLAPAFPFGGMEHVGAVFYNESSFIFREPPTPAQRHARASTIYHEIAHQWFGDLVTMRWFDDLWLKEGFATYMATRVQDVLHPEAGAWRRFYLRTKPPAYAVDATAGTVPVWQELPNLDLAKSNYGPIVYNKAPAILRQLEHMVGAAGFRRGVHDFLTRYAYGNATWQQLLAAIGSASSTELGAFGQHYMLRAGMPVIRPELKLGNDRITELVLVQQPARRLPGDRSDAWPGKVNLRIAFSADSSVVLPVRFVGDRTVVREATGLPAPVFIWPNDGDYGYGLFLPDSLSARWLLANVQRLRNDLLRAQAWGALWDLVREAELAPADYVGRVIEELPAERDEALAGSILTRALTALERYIQPGTAQSLAPSMERLLLARAGDDALPYGLRKASFDAYLSLASTENGQTVLRQFLAEARRFDGKPIAQVSRWSAVRRMVALNTHDAEALLRAETARDTTPEGPRSAFVAAAARMTPEEKKRYFERYFSDATLNEEWVTASLSAFNEPTHAALTLPYLQPALEKAEWIREHRRIFFLPRWLESFIEGQSTPEALQTVDRFLASTPQLPIDLRRKIQQSRDELERTVRIRGESGR